MTTQKNKLHIAIIMDGNGRWATQQGKLRLFGHTKGAQTVVNIIRECPSVGVHTVTLFAFAIANWKRNQKEVDGLCKLFHKFIKSDAQELVGAGVRIVFIGNRDGLPEYIRTDAQKLEKDSKDNATLLLQVALNYDGVEEVSRMVRTTVDEQVSPDDITPEYVQTHLDTQAENDPDIVIRTGMPQGQDGMAVWRSSGFLPIQSAQSVCVSTEVLWPDFTIEHLKKIVSYADPGARLFGGQRG